jgi:hypothetical protein
MRIFKCIFLSFFLLLSAFHVKAFNNVQDSSLNAENKITVDLNACFSSKYIWRGLTYNQGLVLQPEIVVSYKDFYVSSWSNFKIWDINQTNSNEIDFTLGYYHSFSSFDIESYFNYYNYINQPDCPNTGELNVGLYFPTGDFNLFARASVDLISNIGGTYGELGFDYEKELSDKFKVYGTLLTGIGSKKFNQYNLAGWDKYKMDNWTYPDDGKTSLNLVTGNIGLEYSPIKYFSIGADFLLNINIDKDVRNAIGGTSNLFEIILKKEF